MKKLATLLFVVCFVPVWFILACIAMSIGAITYLVKRIDKCVENAFRYACVLLLMATRGKDGAIKLINEAEAEYRKEQ